MAIMNFNYGRAIRQAERIETIGRELKTLADRKLQKSGESIQAHWQGETATLYARKFKGTQDRVSRQGKRAEDLGGRVRRVARILEDAEQRAKEIERQRRHRKDW